MPLRKQDEIAFAEALFTDEETGALGRPLDLTPLHVPQVVELDSANDRLLWSHYQGREDGARATPPPPPRPADVQMLNDFIGLADRPAERIRNFARRWGVLQICRHDLPATHNLPTYSLERRPGEEGPGGNPGAPADPAEWKLLDPAEWQPVDPDWGKPSGCDARKLPEDPRWYWEAIARWREYAREARTMLLVAKTLHDGQPVRREDWASIGLDIPDYHDPHSAALARQQERNHLAGLVTQWLTWGGIRPVVQWGVQAERKRPNGRKVEFARPHIELDPQGLFGVLALQLMTALSRVDGIAFCSACGKPYMPKRKPAAGRRSFCNNETCRLRAAWRLAKRDERIRKRQPKKKAEAKQDIST